MFDYTKLPHPKNNIQLLETIGKGNFGYVYKGKLLSTDEISAIKVVLLKQEEIREILLEVEILEQCRHENLVRYMAAYLKGEQLYICMEFCGGGAVDSLYKNLPRTLSEMEIGVILHQSLSGLAYLHQQHIIHRDLKSGNILLTVEGGIKLADFGVSAQTTKEMGYRAHSFIGTPYWMAPEVILAENISTQMYDCKADIWSIGITAIEMYDKNPPLSDIHPMRALYLIPTIDLALLQPQNPKKHSKPYMQFIQQCLQKDPLTRPDAKQCLQLPYMSQITQQGQSENQKIIKNVLKELSDYKQEKIKIKNIKVEKEESDEEAEFSFENFAGEKEAEVKPEPQGTPVRPPRTSSESSLSYNTGHSQASTPTPTAVTPVMTNSGFGSSQQGSSGRQSSLKSLLKLFKRRTIDEEQLELLNEGPPDQLIKEGDSKDLEVVSLNIQIGCEILTMDHLSILGQENSQAIVHHFVLLGTETGLYVADFNALTNPSPAANRIHPLIRRTRFKQIQVLEDYNLLLCLSGKFNHIRQYSLLQIRKMIASLYQIQLLNELDQNEEKVEHYLFTTQAFHMSAYQKIMDSKESMFFQVTRSQQSIYLSVCMKSQVIVYEWARAPYLKFMKLKTFWIPELPKSLSLILNDDVIRGVVMTYEREIDVVAFESSAVIEIQTPQFIKEQREKLKWLSWQKIEMKENNQQVEVKERSWYQTIKTMKPRLNTPYQQQKELSDDVYLVTCSNRSLVTSSLGLAKNQSPLRSEIDWQWYSRPKEMPSHIFGLYQAEKLWVGIYQTFILCQTMNQSNMMPLIYSLPASNGFKFKFCLSEIDLSSRRTGKILITAFNKKKNISTIFWIKQTELDLNRIEMERRRRDFEVYSQKVIGAGIMVKNLL